MTPFRIIWPVCVGLTLTATGLSDQDDSQDADRVDSRTTSTRHGESYRYARHIYRPCFVRPYSYAHFTYNYPGFEYGVSYHKMEIRPDCGENAAVYKRRVSSVYSSHTVTSSANLGSEVQSALQERGFYEGAIDGDVGPETRAAIRAYQAEKGIGVSGRIDAGLLRSLDIG